MKIIELSKMGLTPIEHFEMKQIGGGGLFKWLKKALGPAAVLWSAISNFGDIREGFSDGWNGKPPRH